LHSDLHSFPTRRSSDLLRTMLSSSLQALMTRAGASVERGRGADAVQMLASALRSSTLTRDDELAVRSMLAEAALLQDDLDQAARDRKSTRLNSSHVAIS